MGLNSPPYFFILPLAQIQNNHLLQETVTSIPQPSFLLVQLLWCNPPFQPCFLIYYPQKCLSNSQ